MVESAAFREDLYYRLNVIELRMPSLRERPEDIAPLAEHILGKLGQEYGLTPPQLHPQAIVMLQGYGFPGNVRELENILERVFTLCEGQWIEPADLKLPNAFVPEPVALTKPTAATGQQAVTDLEGYLETLEREAIVEALQATRYNKTAAAERLGISFRALRYRLKKLGLD